MLYKTFIQDEYIIFWNNQVGKSKSDLLVQVKFIEDNIDKTNVRLEDTKPKNTLLQNIITKWKEARRGEKNTDFQHDWSKVIL